MYERTDVQTAHHGSFLSVGKLAPLCSMAVFPSRKQNLPMFAALNLLCVIVIQISQ